MLGISRSEKCFILTILILGLFLTGISYHRKISSTSRPEIIDINEVPALIDINIASPMQLERLPGIGPVLAQDIVSYRQAIGRFKNKEELKNVKGIRDKKFEKLKDLITISE